jgi:hypothetical protein
MLSMQSKAYSGPDVPAKKKRKPTTEKSKRSTIYVVFVLPVLGWAAPSSYVDPLIDCGVKCFKYIPNVTFPQ